MRVAKAVIGAAFGDEGKGNLTAFFSRSNTTVCRYNGGAQAGHTVQLADGRRHVFHHFGSGSFQGANTYLSRFFISNPILYLQELTDLRKLGVEPTVIADPRGYVTTPYDMMLNQMMEAQRGIHRHGSCGAGINETVKRSEDEGFRITVWDLHDAVSLKDKLLRIRDEWVPDRLAVLGLDPIGAYAEHLVDDGILNHYIADATSFYRSLALLSTSLRGYENIVFEGAQGLMLDQEHYYFPNVTHSHTGLKNIVTLAHENDIEEIDVTYVTRAYATRHGAGPFPREVDGLHYPDPTNVPNDWQGALRFGHLDLDLLVETISNDLRHATTLSVRAGLAVTCLDQVAPQAAIWHGERLHHVDIGSLVQQMQEWLYVPLDYFSDGPTPQDVWTI